VDRNIITQPGTQAAFSLKRHFPRRIEAQTRRTHRIQKGFVRDRNVRNNIVNIDSAGRLYSLMYEHHALVTNISNQPVQALCHSLSHSMCHRLLESGAIAILPTTDRRSVRYTLVTTFNEGEEIIAIDKQNHLK